MGPPPTPSQPVPSTEQPPPLPTPSQAAASIEPLPPPTPSQPARRRIAYGHRGLSAEQHLVALRIQLSQEFKDKFGNNGYWDGVKNAYMLAGFPEHKSLNKALPKLEKEFDEWLKGEGASKTGRENEDELTVARREWADFPAERRQHDEAVERGMQRKKDQAIAASAARDDMMKRQGLKRSRLEAAAAEDTELSDHADSPIDLTSPEAVSNEGLPTTPVPPRGGSTPASRGRSRGRGGKRPRLSSKDTEVAVEESQSFIRANNAIFSWCEHNKIGNERL
ncbi:hypothetical protein KC342_g11018 [Hortaea werneckii]|nr:hypothetical protein KC342_g11018 [Hortaea werneckii]KAI7400861.1 hypothetical protein KC328_g3394 [Hortaea werneckii]